MAVSSWGLTVDTVGRNLKVVAPALAAMAATSLTVALFISGGGSQPSVGGPIVIDGPENQDRSVGPERPLRTAAPDPTPLGGDRDDRSDDDDDGRRPDDPGDGGGAETDGDRTEGSAGDGNAGAVDDGGSDAHAESGGEGAQIDGRWLAGRQR